MRIKSITIGCFRGYSDAVTINVDSMCALVRKNDSGKSTVLEALDIFFNEGKGCAKIDKNDINKICLAAGNENIEIEVEFDEIPTEVVIDSSNRTSLSSEYLLTEDGTLRILKRYPKAGKEKVFIKAHHPINDNCRDLLLKKNSDLKKILLEQSLECSDKTKNSELRKAIWSGQPELQFSNCEIEVAKIDAKDIWEQLKNYMPLYTLFQSDRKNSDGDEEVQDPMRIAVKEILGDQEIKRQLTSVAEIVKRRLDAVAASTLSKLREMNPSIASTLHPELPESDNLKWADVFKSVSITGDHEIPINKRGSGVKRLILVSFFRAEAA
jgi:predicted ATP-dependent endonuclease of OLD family